MRCMQSMKGLHSIISTIQLDCKCTLWTVTNIDRENQEKYYVVSQNQRTSKDRRYQDFDSNAPISKRQTKKRDEQLSDIINVKKLIKYKSNLSDIEHKQKN